MIAASTFAAFALVCLAMVLTPGPNMIYLLSRSALQGRLAGFISLLGVVLGFVVYMLCAAFGLTALLLTLPFAYEAVQWAGAAYLLYLAWSAVRPGARSVLEPRRDLARDGTDKLFAMGFATSLLNPKVAVLYLSLLPQFVDPAAGGVLGQSLTLGLAQIAISFSVNLAIVMTAGSVAGWFAGRPAWLRVQRWTLAGLLAAIALRIAFDQRTA